MADDIAADYVPPATGNHSLITDTVAVTEFLDAVSKGNYIETACKAAGLSKQTVYQWLKRGDAGETPFKAFRDALEKAEAKAELEVLETVRRAGQAGPQYWPASMTLLERRHPEKWGKRQDAESGPKVVVQIGVQATDVSVTFASSASLSPAAHHDLPQLSTGQVEIQGLINRDSVTPIPAPAVALPAASRGRGLTGPAGVGGGMAPDGLGERKAPRRRVRKEKKEQG